MILLQFTSSLDTWQDRILKKKNSKAGFSANRGGVVIWIAESIYSLLVLIRSASWEEFLPSSSFFFLCIVLWVCGFPQHVTCEVVNNKIQRRKGWVWVVYVQGYSRVRFPSFCTITHFQLVSQEKNFDIWTGSVITTQQHYTIPMWELDFLPKWIFSERTGRGDR